MINIGKLDRRITIEQKTEGLSSTGAVLDSSWGTLDTVWAKVIQKSGRELLVSDQVNAQADVVFRIRYRSDVTEKMRILYNSEYYDITYIKELGRQDALEITATVRNR